MVGRIVTSHVGFASGRTAPIRDTGQGTPLWASSRSPEDAPSPTVSGKGVVGRQSADVVIVGAGLTGLATAQRLAEAGPGRDILVVDAGVPGAGASGRGTGLLGPRVGPGIERLRRRYGDATAGRMHQASVEAVHQVIGLADHLGVDCDLRPGEQLVVARSTRGAVTLQARAQAYRELGLDVPERSAAEIRQLVDVPTLGGLAYPMAATLNPSAVVWGLARSLAASGVRRYDNSPVLTLDQEAGLPVLRFPAGSVRARTVVFAVNGYSDRLPLGVGAVLPVEVHAVATAPLPEPARRALGWDHGAAVLDLEPLAPYFRLTGDGRLVLGGGDATYPVGLSPSRLTARRVEVWTWLERRLRSLHPDLVDVPVEHRWAGRIGLTLDGLPVVGRLAGRQAVWFAGGCCGHGLAMSVFNARAVADAVLGGSLPELPWFRGRASRLPSGAPTRLLLRRYVATLNRRARKETEAAERRNTEGWPRAQPGWEPANRTRSRPPEALDRREPSENG
jgi:glycine/D-amino acid oxidase-like deaminating enzyme